MSDLQTITVSYFIGSASVLIGFVDYGSIIASLSLSLSCAVAMSRVNSVVISD